MSQRFTPDELRQRYLQFFEEPPRHHTIIPSAPLVPENDPTTLFTGSGMQPLLPYLLGEEHPGGQRLVDSQKAFRSVDIEEVGDNSHTTFFEMLGNWSLGDYFKQEQLGWFLTFLTEEVGLDPQNIYVTVYSGNQKLSIPRDEEAIKIWQDLFAEHDIESPVVENPIEEGMQDGRIFFYGDDKNWWSRAGTPDNMPAGEPGGPSSETFYDFGTEYGFHANSEWADQPCHVNCDCGRFLEIGNSVFMQYQKQDDGSFTELPQQNIDFGGGFERILAAQYQTPDVFQTPLFAPLIEQIEDITGQEYTGQASFRVIADHVRAAVMLASDGVLPSSQEQGYYVRRLLRRSIRHAMMLGVEESFVAKLVPVVAEMYSQPYPEVTAQVDEITTASAPPPQKPL